jgi:hypothetical protein
MTLFVSSITLYLKDGIRSCVMVMNMQVVRWFLDLGMGIFFLISVITGLFKFTLLMRALGLTGWVLPLAQMSDIHDWSGLALAFFVAAHLIINRAWIMSMTRKIFRGENTS